MGKRLRFWMLWLLACALPLQGIAAAAMLHCAPQQGRVAMAAPTALVHAGHGHAADHDQHEQHVHHGHDADAEPVDAASTGDADGAASGAHACSACAQCSNCSALPMQALSLPAAPVPGAVRTPAPVLHAGVVPDGLERPPRFLPA